MKTVHVDTRQRSYDILIGPGLLPELGARLKALLPGCPSVLAVTDDTVAPLWLGRAVESLKAAGFTAYSFALPHGEGSKTLETLTKILQSMELCGMQRGSAVVALGGGVVGDLAGLAAALYMRGIPFVQVPTTILAAQDSSVGGKTAVNMGAKNIVGAFWQPSLVLCDTDMFSTLPRSVFNDGCAEMIKHGVIADAGLFEQLEQGAVDSDLAECIRRSVSVKARVVSADELDIGLRNLLNFGHTVGHAIEKCTNFAVTHGSAVAAGMCVMARACEKQGIAAAGTGARLAALLESFALPTGTSCPPDALWQAALEDKKRSGGEISLIRVRRIGDCYVSREPVEALRRVLEDGM